MQHAGVHILKSKLRPPQLKNAVPRPRLMELLLENGDKSVVVIRADAGYGKTTLAAQYLQAAGAIPAWYRLDESDAALPVFLTYLAAALQSATGDVSSDSSGWTTYLQRGTLDERSAVAAFAGWLEEQIGAPTALVLDDYHTVDGSQGVRRALELLLENLPDDLRIVLLTRVVPSLNLARLGAAGEVVSLSSEQLEFSGDETRALWIARGLTSRNAEDGLRKARDLTRGWAAGLILFSDWIRRGHSPNEASVDTLATQDEVYDYLAQEVFDRQPTEVQRFLLDTCVLEEMGEREAAQLGCIENPAILLSHVARESLFFRRTQQTSIAYSCHPLFARFLESRLERERGPGAARDLHARAARLYESTGDLDRAVGHAVASEDATMIRAITERRSSAIVQAHRPDLAEKLLACLPDASGQAWAWALRGYVCRCSGDHTAALAVLRKAAAGIRRHESTGIRRLVLELLSWTYVALTDYRRAAETCEAALQACSAERGDLLLARASLYVNLGFCKTRAANMSAGLAAGRRALSVVRRASAVDRAVAAARYGFLLIACSDFRRAEQYVDEALHAVTKDDQSNLYSSWMANNCATVAMELGCYRKALDLAHDSMGRARRSPYWHDDLALAEETLADVLFGLGDVEAAAAGWRGCTDYARTADDTELESVLCGDLSSCARLRGENAAALCRATEALELVPKSDVPLVIRGKLSHAAALVASGDLQAATSDLRDVAKITRRPGFGRSEVWCRWLKADIARRAGRMHHCDQHLAKALSIARQNRYVHLMIVEGRIAPELLIRALEKDIETEFACEILSRIGPWLLPHAKTLLNSDDPRLILLGIRILNDSGRSWARGPLLDAVRHKDPQISKTAAEALAQLPVQQEDKLRITGFGNFKVVCGEREVMWRKRKAKHLMEYLFVNRRRKVPKDVLIDTFWPDSSLSAAVNNFYVTFHALKRSLNPHLQRREQLPYFTADDNMFQLVAETFSSDVDDFVTALAQAKRHRSDGQTEEAISALRRCEELYTGDLMEDNLYEDWTAQDRQELREAYFDAMGLLAQLLSSTGENEQSVRVLRRLASKDKTREDLHLMIAEQYVKLGNRALAARQRKLCERALSEELGVDVSPEIHEAFDALLAATPA